MPGVSIRSIVFPCHHFLLTWLTCLLTNFKKARAEETDRSEGNPEGARVRLMVNFKVLSVVLLLSLMLLVLPVILPPLPPPPPILMLLPVVIFILLMLIAFLPSGFNVIAVSFVSCADGVNKRIPVTAQVRNAYRHVLARNSESELQQDMLIASSCKHFEMIDEHFREDGFAKLVSERLKSVNKLAGTIL